MTDTCLKPKLFNPLQETIQKQKKLWERVKEMEECHDPSAADQLGEIRATLLVNFGPDSKRPLIKDTSSTLSMMIDVLTELTKPNNEEE